MIGGQQPKQQQQQRRLDTDEEKNEGGGGGTNPLLSQQTSPSSADVPANSSSSLSDLTLFPKAGALRDLLLEFGAEDVFWELGKRCENSSKEEREGGNEQGGERVESGPKLFAFDGLEELVGLGADEVHNLGVSRNSNIAHKKRGGVSRNCGSNVQGGWAGSVLLLFSMP